MKGPRLREELPQAGRVIKALNCEVTAVHPVQLAGTDGHVICEIRKLGGTDPQFPRDPSIAKGKPI